MATYTTVEAVGDGHGFAIVTSTSRLGASISPDSTVIGWETHVAEAVVAVENVDQDTSRRGQHVAPDTPTLDPEAMRETAILAETTIGTARSGFTSEGGFAVHHTDLETARQGSGLSPDAPEVVGMAEHVIESVEPALRPDDYTRQALEVNSHDEGTAATTDTITYRVGQFNQPVQTTADFDPGGAEMGAILPTAYLRRVTGTCYDEEGERITNARYIVALDHLAVAGFVDDNGEYDIYLLRQMYEHFVLVAESQEQGVDYAWYLAEDTQVGAGTDEADLVFARREVDELEGIEKNVLDRPGLFVGGGVRMG